MAILGIDEVGRGPLAGPLVVGAVVLPELSARPEWVAELKDSKKLSAKKREKLSELILAEAPATGLGWVPASEIDSLGISAALKLATRRAVEAAQSHHVAFSQIIIDGKINFLAGTRLENYVSTKVKADDLIKEVSAASIIAKVARDNYMVEAAARHPGYGFEKHVGYGTAAHLAALHDLGVCPEHRLSFEPCKSMVGFVRSSSTSSSVTGSAPSASITKAAKSTTSIGQQAEESVAEYLVKQGHEIVVRNFKTKLCEIDIISLHADKIYFTEVKYRATSIRGGGLAAITQSKQAQMRFAAESFLKLHPHYRAYDPLLAVAAVSGEDFTVEDWFALDS